MEHKLLSFEVTDLNIEGRTLEGYASVFGNIDLGGDIVHPGAFTKTLAERGDKVKFLWQHDMQEPLGRPLELREDGRGLFIKAIISDTVRGRDALALLRDGAIDGMSIGYDAVKGGTDYDKADNGDTVRNLRELRLWEFSLVTLGMNEEAQVTALKEQEPTEAKPAPEVTENTIRIRVREPSDFQEDSFRTITIGDEDDGIQAVIGRLDGETSTTVQAFVFDKEKFTVAEAQEWVDEHEKQTVPVEAEKAEPEAASDEEIGEEEKGTTEAVKAVDLTQYVADVRTAFESQYNPPNDMWRYWVMAVYDEYVIVQDNDAADGVGFYQVGYVRTEDAITFTSQGEWIGGDYVFVPHDVSPESELARDAEGDETKAGRVLAGRNETRIVSALLTLIDVLDDAGIELPGFEKNPIVVIPEEEASAPVKQAASDDREAGPIVDDESPTLRELVLKLEIENLADWLKEQAESLAKLNKEVS